MNLLTIHSQQIKKKKIEENCVFVDVDVDIDVGFFFFLSISFFVVVVVKFEILIYNRKFVYRLKMKYENVSNVSFQFPNHSNGIV